MNRRLYLALAAALGIVTGVFTIHSFFAHSWTSMILWVVVGIALLSFAPDRRRALWGGAVFGFVDIAAWLVSGFQGASSAIPGFLVLTLGLSIAGAACGAIGAWIFNKLLRR